MWKNLSGECPDEAKSNESFLSICGNQFNYNVSWFLLKLQNIRRSLLVLRWYIVVGNLALLHATAYG